MEKILKDFIYFTNMENIENLNHNIQEKFSLEKNEEIILLSILKNKIVVNAR